MFPFAWTISAHLSLALSSGRSFRKESLESRFRMGSAIHLSLGAINSDTTPVWIEKKLNLKKKYGLFDKAQEGEICTHIIHIYFKLNSKLSPSKKSAFLMCPPWERAPTIRVVNVCPLHSFAQRGRFVSPHLGPACPRTAQLKTLCSVQIWLSKVELFLLSEITSPSGFRAFGTWKPDIFWTEMKASRITEYGREKRRQKSQRSTDESKHSKFIWL